MVYFKDGIGNGVPPLFNGDPFLKKEKINVKKILNILYYPKLEHYDVITNITRVSACKNFRPTCNVGTNRVSGHKYLDKCIKCFSNLFQ